MTSHMVGLRVGWVRAVLVMGTSFFVGLGEDRIETTRPVGETSNRFI